MYACRHFQITELVSPWWQKSASARGKTSLLWLAFDSRLLVTIDRLRELFGPLIINNWNVGGPRSQSGLRESNSSTGALISPHKFGRALDFVSGSVTPDEIYQSLVQAGGLKPGFRDRVDGQAEPWRLITRLEYAPGMTWTHIDVADAGNDDGSIRVFQA